MNIRFFYSELKKEGLRKGKDPLNSFLEENEFNLIQNNWFCSISNILSSTFNPFRVGILNGLSIIPGCIGGY